MFAKMVNLARTADEVKEDAPMPAVTGGKFTGPKYPYGTCLYLEQDTLQKLGLSGDLPAVGEVIHFTAIAKVTSASENERETTDGATEKCCRIELQITDMGVPDPEPQRKWYGKPDSDNDNAD